MHFLTHAAKAPSAWVVVFAMTLGVLANSSDWPGVLNSTKSHAEERVANATQAQAIREGAILPDQVGQFKIVGERILFTDSESSRVFRCLENLMLQRVHQVITEEANPSSWIVSGKATEYRGENFLFIEAVRRTK